MVVVGGALVGRCCYCARDRSSQSDNNSSSSSKLSHTHLLQKVVVAFVFGIVVAAVVAFAVVVADVVVAAVVMLCATRAMRAMIAPKIMIETGTIIAITVMVLASAVHTN